MKKNKIISLLLMATLLVGTVSGCTGSGSETAATKDADTTEQSAGTDAAATDSSQASSTDAPTLTWWIIGNQPENLADGIKQLNDYTAESIGVKIDLKVAGWGEWSDKMNQIVNAGDPFDIMFTNNTKYNLQVTQGAFADITDLVQQETPDLYKAIPEKVWEGAKIGGKIYSVPTYKDSSVTQYAVFDHAYVEKYNLDISGVTTLQDLDAPLRAIKEGEGKSVYPMPLIQGDGFSGLLNAYDDLTIGLPPIGVRVDDAQRKVVCVIEQADTMEQLKLLHTWYNDGIINQDAPTLKDAPKNRIFFSAQGFPGAEINWAINEGVEKYDMVQTFGPLYTTGTIQGSLNAISSNSQYKTEALKYLQAVNTDHKLRDMLGFGVEGADYEYVSDNVIRRLTDTWGIGNYAIGTFFNMSTTEGAQEDQWEQVKALNEKADSSVCLGYAFDLTNVGSEVANCRATWDKYKYELLTGASDPETMVPQIVAELKAAGMDTIITEAQSQIDEFFK